MRRRPTEAAVQKRAIGELMLYGHELGAILRSVDCDTALLRITLAVVTGSTSAEITYLRIAADIH
jgi:hypothetical protein